MSKESALKSKIQGKGYYFLAVLLSAIFLGWTVIYNLVYPLAFTFVLILSAFIISRWAYNNRDKVIPYIFADTFRIFTLASIFVIFQLAFPYPGELVWFCSALLIGIIVTFIVLILDCKNWEALIRIGKATKKSIFKKGFLISYLEILHIRIMIIQQ